MTDPTTSTSEPVKAPVDARDGTGGAGRRTDLRTSMTRDLDRYARRERDASSFWQSLGLLGSVGWPIVVAAVGGAVAGRWLDATWDTGIRFTLILLVAGVVCGAAIAWHLVKPQPK